MPNVEATSLQVKTTSWFIGVFFPRYNGQTREFDRWGNVGSTVLSFG